MVTQAEIDAFGEYYVEKKAQTDERIEEILDASEDLAGKRKLLAHSVEGGKRIRPVMTLLSAEAFDTPTDRALDHASIVELIHNASLVADDRYDDDEMRRGAPTLWRVMDKLPFGRKGRKVTTGMTIMAENGLVALAIELAEDPSVVKAVGRGLHGLVDGFFMEGSNITWGYLGGGYDKYIEVNKAKTGSLFALAAWMPATYVDPPEDEEEAARKWGEETGILYQIADDIADGDLPSFIEDPEEELEKWYHNAVSHVEMMGDHDRADEMRVAPAFMVYKMFEQEGLLGEYDVSFLPSEG